MYKYLKYTVEDNKEKAEKVINIVVETSEIQKSIEEAVKELQKTVKIKGFRPGNAPKDVIMKNFPNEIVNESSSHLFNDLLNQVLEKEKIVPVAVTQVENKDNDADGNSILEFHIPIYSEVEIPNLDEIKVEPVNIELKDEEIKNGVNRIWKNYVKEGGKEDEPNFSEENFKEMNIDGVSNIDQLREWVKSSLINFKTAETKDKFGQDFIEKAIEKSGIIIHDQIVNEEIDKRQEELTKLAKQDGTTLDEILKSHNMNRQEYRDRMKTDIVKSIQLEIFLRELAKKWNVEIDDETVKEELQRAPHLLEHYNDEEYAKRVVRDSLSRNKAFTMVIEKYYPDQKA